MGKIKKLILIKSALVLMVLFQNCGEELDLSSYEDAASITTGVYITGSAAYIENTNYSLVANVLETQAVSYRWFKDGLEITGETGQTLDFAPIELTDSGTYEVRIIDIADREFSNTTVVTVEEDPNAPTTQVRTDTFFTLAGNNYFIYSFGTQTPAQRKMTADAFCVGKLGAGSESINNMVNAVAQLTQRYAYATDAATCNLNQFRQGYVSGHCLAFIPGSNLQLIRYTSVECQL